MRFTAYVLYVYEGTMNLLDLFDKVVPRRPGPLNMQLNDWYGIRMSYFLSDDSPN